MLNDLLIAHAAIAIRPEPFRIETSRLAFQPLSPWMIDELRRRAEQNRRQDAPQVELPLEQPPPRPLPVQDWQD